MPLLDASVCVSGQQPSRNCHLCHPRTLVCWTMLHSLPAQPDADVTPSYPTLLVKSVDHAVMHSQAWLLGRRHQVGYEGQNPEDAALGCL